MSQDFPFIGEVRILATNTLPEGHLECDGSLLDKQQYGDLFDVIGYTYGGDNANQFALPDLRGRVPVHTGGGRDLTERKTGDSFGASTHALSESEMAPHRHELQVSVQDATTTDPSESTALAKQSGDAKAYTADGGNGALSTAAVQTAGGSEAHNNMQPYIALCYAIVATGDMPAFGAQPTAQSRIARDVQDDDEGYDEDYDDDDYE